MDAMLDTSVCIEIMRGNAPQDCFRGWHMSISSVVESELWAGVFHTGGVRERDKVMRLLSAVEVVSFDSNAARKTGLVLGSLARQGLHIGDFDSLIAGHCLALDRTLITANIRHFERVNGLRFLSWR